MELYQELFSAFGGLLVDVPFAVLSLTLLWRAPIAFKSLMDSVSDIFDIHCCHALTVARRKTRTSNGEAWS